MRDDLNAGAECCPPHASSLLGFGVHRLEVEAVADASQQHRQELGVQLFERLLCLFHLEQDDECRCNLCGQTDRQTVSQTHRLMDTDISRSQSSCLLVQLTARGRGVSIRIISPEFPLAFSWYGCPKVSVSNMWLKMLLTSCLSLPRVVHMSVVTWILCQVERGRTSGRGR